MYMTHAYTLIHDAFTYTIYNATYLDPLSPCTFAEPSSTTAARSPG